MTADFAHYERYITDDVLQPFYAKRMEALQKLTLERALNAKNPYLFSAKNIQTSEVLVTSIIDARLSSQEESIFGNLMEGFAIYVSEMSDGGRKRSPPLRSIDLEFERDEIYYIISIKSGTVWGNSDQIMAMRNNFKQAKEFLRLHEGLNKQVVAVNGCIYGRDSTPLKVNTDPEKTYYKYAGQDFWHFISGDDDLYRRIIQPIEEQSRQTGPAFQQMYVSKINQMTQEFSEMFLTANGQIDWDKLIEFVSKRRL